MTTSPPGQNLCLTAGQEEQTRGISGTAVGEGSEHRKSERHHGSQKLEILGGYLLAMDGQGDGVEQHRAEC